MSDDEKFLFIGGDGEELPEPIKELLKSIIGNTLHSESAHDSDADVINPAVEQYNLGPNDLCVIAEGDVEAADEQMFDLVELLDPAEFAGEFPDWEERVMNSYVLGNWYGEENEEGQLGWFPRVKLMKIDQDQWIKFWQHNFGGVRLDIPSGWITQRFSELVIGLADANPDLDFPRPIQCMECGGLTVFIELRTTRMVRSQAGAFHGQTDKDPNHLYGISNVNDDRDAVWHLWCCSCDYRMEIPESVRIFYNERS